MNALGENFHQGEALSLLQKADRFADGVAGLKNFRCRGQRDAFDVDRCGEGVDHLADLQGVAVGFDLASAGACGGFLSGEGGGGHLSAGHAVGRVVDEEDRHVFAAVRRLEEFIETDGGEVAVALVRDHEVFRERADQAGSDCGCPSVRDRDPSAVVVVIGEDRAADRGNNDGLFLNSMIFHRLGDQLVQDSVSAAGAVVHVLLDRAGTAFKGVKKDFGFSEFDSFSGHFSILLSEARGLFHRSPGPTEYCRPCGLPDAPGSGIQWKV